MIYRFPTISPICLELKTGLMVTRPGHCYIAILRKCVDLLPYHFAYPLGHVPDVNTGADLNKPDGKPAT